MQKQQDFRKEVTSSDLRTRIRVDSTDMAIMGGKPPLPELGCPNTGAGVEHVHVINKSSFPSVPLVTVDSSVEKSNIASFIHFISFTDT
jgi:hypothetical protein